MDTVKLKIELHWPDGPVFATVVDTQLDLETWINLSNITRRMCIDAWIGEVRSKITAKHTVILPESS